MLIVFLPKNRKKIFAQVDRLPTHLGGYSMLKCLFIQGAGQKIAMSTCIFLTLTAVNYLAVVERLKQGGDKKISIFLTRTCLTLTHIILMCADC